MALIKHLKERRKLLVQQRVSGRGILTLGLDVRRRGKEVNCAVLLTARALDSARVREEWQESEAK